MLTNWGYELSSMKRAEYLKKYGVFYFMGNHVMIKC